MTTAPKPLDRNDSSAMAQQVPRLARLRAWAAYLMARVALLAVLLALSNAAHAQTVTPVPGTADMHFAMALEAQTLGDVASMTASLRAAAQDKHLRAQELLGAVLLHGPAWFGSHAPHDPCEARRWFDQAAQQGSAVGRMYRSLLNRQNRIGLGIPCG